MKITDCQWDFLIVGSGPAGMAALQEIDCDKFKVLLIDGGQQPDQVALQRKSQSREDILQGRPVDDSYSTAHTLRDSPIKKWFGSDHSQKDISSIRLSEQSDIGFRPSFSVGGLSNVWGANMEEFESGDFDECPGFFEQVAIYYPRVRRLLHSGEMLIDSDVTINPRLARLLANPRDGRLTSLFRKTELALVQGIDTQCRTCGNCLTGCAFDAIFDSGRLLKNPYGNGLVYRPGHVAQKIVETDTGVQVTCVQPDGVSVVVNCSRVLLAAGPMISTALTLTALGEDWFAIVGDCQAITVPLLSLRSLKSSRRHVGLAQISTTLRARRTRRSQAYFQFYDNNTEIQKAITAICRRLKIQRSVEGILRRRLLAMHGFLNVSESSQLKICIDASRSNPLVINTSVVMNPRTRRVVRQVVLRVLPRLVRNGIVPLIPLVRTETVGHSFHIGSVSFVRACDNYRCDNLGRPPFLNRTHIVDATSLPYMPPQSPTSTIMANAMRIAESISQFV